MNALADLPQALALPTLQALRDGYRRARAAGGSRHRDIAAALGVSEGELIAAHVQAEPRAGLSARRLAARWPSILKALPEVGEVMALTRNPCCVHERTGRYEDVQAGDDGAGMGLVLGPDIDLRVFFRAWAHGFAVEETSGDGDTPPQRSLQFFDAQGVAVHKVFVRARTDLAAWTALVERFAEPEAAPGLTAAPAREPATERPDAAIDVAALQHDWAALRDTHEFFGLLKRHGVSRTQALRLAEPRFVRRVEPSSARALLEHAAASGTPIMVFVGNPGMIQIHTGPVRRVAVMGPWLNVLDPAFNLHLREDLIAQAWVVRKPTSDGLVTSLELFDATGETIAMLFGERKPGRAELCAWRQITDRLVDDAGWAEEHAPCAAC